MTSGGLPGLPRIDGGERNECGATAFSASWKIPPPGMVFPCGQQDVSFHDPPLRGSFCGRPAK